MSRISITSHLDPEAIKINLESTTKNEVIEELLSIAVDRLRLEPTFKRDLLETVLRREQKASTGLVGGIAIPHAKTDLIDDLVVVVGIRPEGIDFGAPDSKPSTIFILTLSPIQKTQTHLELLSFLCERLNSTDLRKKVLAAKDATSVRELLTC